MKLMDIAISTSCIFLGLLSATSATYAQEAGQKLHQKSRSIVGNTTGYYEKLLREAEALIQRGKAGEAYLLLDPLEFEHAGEARFDYLIGIAALDSGRPDRATFAFERVLAVNPDHPSARLDMARAYYQLGDLPRAKTEFTSVLKQKPSDASRASIQKYLDAIAAHKDGKRTPSSGYVEVGVGRDSNVNSSTSQLQIFVDKFATSAPLDPINVKVADNYYAVTMGGEINHSLNANWGLYAGGDLQKRGNSNQTQFDSLGLNVRAGVKFEAKANRIRVGMLKGQYYLGGAHNNDTTGFKGDWRHAFSPSNQLNAFVQSLQYRYIDTDMQINDFDQQATGLGWLHAMADGKSSISGSLHYGAEDDVSPTITAANPQGGRSDGAKRFSGLRIGGQSAFSETTTLFANAGMQVGIYDKTHTYFLRQRNDRLYDLTIGANWQLDKQWTLRPQLNSFRNVSNIDIYSYDRMDASLTIRRDFR